MNLAEVKQAEKALADADPVLGELIRSQQLMRQPGPRAGDYFAALSRSIIGQQVSVKAAAAIYGRFESMTQLDPARVVELDEESIRAIGLSKQKAGYLRDLATHFTENPGIYNNLQTQTDEQVITELTAVKGIGIWTAQMFLMFTLGRPDVFAPDDLGLLRAIERLYNLEVPPSRRDLAAFAERWAPYRTIASLHLWQSLDNTPGK